MIRYFSQKLHSELIKIRCMNVWTVVTILVTIVQGLLAFVSARQNLAIGLDATPETCPSLLEPMPPLAFIPETQRPMTN
ncbi:MAG: hypothetical protein IIY70_03140 [Oscillospiraceae bacterium]|nr:hypothetical protein [Oscillospiraceae bacterium]